MSRVSPKRVFGYIGRLDNWTDDHRGCPPVTIEWDISNRCVLGCMDCHFSHTHVKGPWAGRRVLPLAYDAQDTGDLADIELVRNVLPEAWSLGVRSVVWSGGGEPTVHPQWMDAVIAAKATWLEQGMYTCGTLLDATGAALLAQAARWVVVSLDACDAGTYADEKKVNKFADACRGVQLLAAARDAYASDCAVGVSFLLHGRNWRLSHRMLLLARELGASYATFRPAIRADVIQPSVLFGYDWVADAMPTLERLSREPDVEIDPPRFAACEQWTGHGYTKCYGVRLYATVTPDGRVWMCPQRRGVTPLGDLRQESLQAIWARHPGEYVVDDGCRAMCRLHLVNEELATVYAKREHEAFL